MARWLRACLIALGLGGVFLVFDFVYGEVSGIAQVREDARKFRSEAALLRTQTKSLVPNLTHVYPDAYRPEAEAFIRKDLPRQLHTTARGTVATGNGEKGSTSRILFLGGSTTECNEVDEQFRFASVVETNLRKGGLAAETINAGVRGHTTLDAINLLLNRPEFGRPAFVVLMENINDRLLLAVRHGYGATLSDAAPTTSAAVKEAAMGTLVGVWDYLTYRSNVLFFAQSVSRQFGGGYDTKGGYITERTLDDLPTPSSEARDLYVQNLKVFVAVARAMGSAPVLMTQPLGIRSKGQDFFNEAIREVARNTGAILIDLDALLPGDRGWAYLGDNIHYSNRGSRAIGNLISAALAPLLGAHYSAPVLETGLTSLAALADRCGPETAIDEIHPVSERFQIVGDSGRYPTVSPDARWLLFQTRTSGSERIRVLRLEDHQLFDVSPADTTTSERHPVFLESSTTSFTIVFGQRPNDDQTKAERLMVRSWPSGETKPLYANSEISGSIPSVRGRMVYFAGGKVGSDITNLYTMAIDGREPVQLTETRLEEWRPAASISGDLYYIGNDDGRFAIYRIDARTNAKAKVISSGADEWDPAVSPDGKWLAFASKRFGSWDIFIAPTSNPSLQRRLTAWPGEEWDPAWHPNGRAILFGSAQFGEPRIMAICPFGTPHSRRNQ